jgi:hypothetical protein
LWLFALAAGIAGQRFYIGLGVVAAPGHGPSKS